MAVDAGPATIRSVGRPSLAWTDLLARNRIDPEDAFARQLAAAGTVLEVSVPSRGAALSDRLAAARRATALAAILTDLPIGVGAVQLWSDRVLTPSQAREVADSAAAGDIPLLDWTLPLLFHHEPGDASRGLVSGTTVGLSALLGFELETRRSPEPAGMAIAALLAVAQEIVTRGRLPKEGARVHPFDETVPGHLLRAVPEGLLGNDTDRWCLVHPDSPFDHRRLLGQVRGLGLPIRSLRGLDTLLRGGGRGATLVTPPIGARRGDGGGTLGGPSGA
jgi:hypothetical protein